MTGAPIGPGVCVERDGTAHAGGRDYAVATPGPCEVVQRYLAGTPLLQTVVLTETGSVAITDLCRHGGLVRVVVPLLGEAGVVVEGACADAGARVEALHAWWAERPDASGPERELLLLSAALTAACGATPTAGRDPAEIDDLGLWRLPDGSADLGAHAAYAQRSATTGLRSVGAPSTSISTTSPSRR